MTHAVLAEHVHVSVRKNCSACCVRTQCGATFFTRQLSFVAFDVRLKGEMDGVEAAREIKRLRDIPIIFITADTDEERCGAQLQLNQMAFSSRREELLIAIGNEVGTVIAKLQADESARATLKEKETLLEEIHRWVKNNLQILSSLLTYKLRKLRNQKRSKYSTRARGGSNRWRSFTRSCTARAH